jgi:hypothetical protein
MIGLVNIKQIDLCIELHMFAYRENIGHYIPYMAARPQAQADRTEGKQGFYVIGYCIPSHLRLNLQCGMLFQLCEALFS